MVECFKHPGNFRIPGDECVSCATERRNAETRARAAAAKAKAMADTKKKDKKAKK